MIVLSAGMQKAGTGWYFNLTNDLLVAAGHQDVHAIRERFNLHSVLRHHNCNVGKLSLFNLIRLAIPHFLGNTFVVKTHSKPTSALRCLLYAGIFRATYIYRDPRDVAASIFEHGERIRREGSQDSFGRLATMKEAILFTKRLLTIWDAWMRCNQALTLRYEDLLDNPMTELERLSVFLSLDVSAETRARIASNYAVGRLSTSQMDYLHFNKGSVGRFAEVLSLAEQELCRKHFGDYLQKLGYQ